MASSPRVEIEALLALVQKSALTAAAEYEKGPQGSIPSLDTFEKHPSDEVAPSFVLRRAIKDLEGACERLCTTLAPSSHTLLNRSMSFYDVTALEVVLQAKIADILVDHPQGLPVTKLSEISGLNADKLSRILRLLATQHCFVEFSPDVFANNRLSHQLVSTTDTAALISLFTRDIMPGSIAMGNALLDPEYKESLEPSKSPFIYCHKDMGVSNLFDYFGKVPERGVRFDRGMQGWAQMNDGFAVVDNYPWEKMPDGTTVCDLGGGIGHISVALINKHPQLRITVQDRPQQVNLGLAFCATACPQAVKHGHLAFQVWNAFGEPPLPKQDVYYLRQVCHNWPDTNVEILLKNVESAMGPNSRFLIHDYVMPISTKRDSNTTADFPLLANFGAGNIRRYRQDMNMLNMANAKERTLDQFIALGNKAGLDFVKLWEFAENEMIEFVSKRFASE